MGIEGNTCVYSINFGKVLYITLKPSNFYQAPLHFECNTNKKEEELLFAKQVKSEADKIINKIGDDYLDYSMAHMDVIIKELELINFVRVKKDYKGEYHTPEFRKQVKKEIELLEKYRNAMIELEDETK